MQTINSEKSDYQVFLEPETNEYLGFSGTVQVHNSEVFVDTRTGEGYDRVLQKLEKLICFLASKYHFKGQEKEDTKQHIRMRILEGIPKFDPRKEVKLSTFIQMRVNRRLINELRDERHISKNATFLNINSYSYLCGCGNSFVLVISEDYEQEHACPKCNSSIKNARKVPVGFSEVSLDSHFSCIREGESDEDSGDFELILANENSFTEDDIILKHDMDTWLEKQEPEVAQLIELIVHKDYSVSKAAKEMGLTNAYANSKLKRLVRDNKDIKRILGK